MSLDQYGTNADASISKPDEEHEGAGKPSSLTRRALIRSGWALPVILSLTLPDVASAQSDDYIGGDEENGKRKAKAKGKG